jgi:hypothetical protein
VKITKLHAVFCFAVLLAVVPARAATLYIATNGSDSNPCTQSAPCASFNGAYQKAAGGDTVEIAGGTYGSQSLTAATKGSVVTLRAASGASVTIGSLTINTRFVEVQNVRATGHINIGPSNNVWSNSVNHITLRNVSGKSMMVVAEDVLVQGGDFGGFDGCNASNQEDVIDVWQLPDSGGTYHASNRVTFDGVTVHDITDHNNTCSDVSGSGNGRHVDCMQILAGHYITVRNSTFYNCATSDIIARPFRDSLDNLLFENNFFGEVLHPGAALNLGASGDTFGGTNIVRYNVIQSAGIQCSPSPGCMQIYGNIMAIGSCQSGSYSYNVFFANWSATCGSNSKRGNPSFVGPTPNPGYMNGIRPNYHLASNDTVALNAGDPNRYPATDIDGQARKVGAAPEAGADEIGSAAAGPNPPTNVQVTVD